MFRRTAFRRVTAVVSVVIAGAALTACGSAGGSEPATLKVAIFPTLSGSLAVAGEAVKTGAELAVDQINAAGGILGHKVELIELETDGSAAKTQQLVRRAVQREGAHFLTGIVSSPEVVASFPQLKLHDAVLISASSKADDILAECNDNTVITTPTNSMSVRAVTSYLTGRPAKQWSVVAVDTVSGKGAVDAFVADMKAQGQRVADPIYVPASTTDFGSIIAQLRAQGSDALFSSIYGSASGSFLKQAAQFGLLGTYHTVAGQSFNTELLWGSMGDTAYGTVGNVGNIGYIGDDPVVRNQLNDNFTSAYQARFGHLPSYSASDSYLGFQALFAAVRKSSSIDPDTVRKALRGLSFDSILGTVTIRPEDGLMIRQEYAGEVVRKDGKPAWKLLKEVPGNEIAPPVRGC